MSTVLRRSVAITLPSVYVVTVVSPASERPWRQSATLQIHHACTIRIRNKRGRTLCQSSPAP